MERDSGHDGIVSQRILAANRQKENVNAFDNASLDYMLQQSCVNKNIATKLPSDAQCATEGPSLRNLRNLRRDQHASKFGGASLDQWLGSQEGKPNIRKNDTTVLTGQYGPSLRELEEKRRVQADNQFANVCLSEITVGSKSKHKFELVNITSNVDAPSLRALGEKRRNQQAWEFGGASLDRQPSIKVARKDDTPKEPQPVGKSLRELATNRRLNHDKLFPAATLQACLETQSTKVRVKKKQAPKEEEVQGPSLREMGVNRRQKQESLFEDASLGSYLGRQGSKKERCIPISKVSVEPGPSLRELEASRRMKENSIFKGSLDECIAAQGPRHRDDKNKNIEMGLNETAEAGPSQRELMLHRRQEKGEAWGAALGAVLESRSRKEARKKEDAIEVQQVEGPSLRELEAERRKILETEFAGASLDRVLVSQAMVLKKEKNRHPPVPVQLSDCGPSRRELEEKRRQEIEKQFQGVALDVFLKEKEKPVSPPTLSEVSPSKEILENTTIGLIRRKSELEALLSTSHGLLRDKLPVDDDTGPKTDPRGPETVLLEKHLQHENGFNGESLEECFVTRRQIVSKPHYGVGGVDMDPYGNPMSAMAHRAAEENLKERRMQQERELIYQFGGGLDEAISADIQLEALAVADRSLGDVTGIDVGVIQDKQALQAALNADRDLRKVKYALRPSTTQYGYETVKGPSTHQARRTSEKADLQAEFGGSLQPMLYQPTFPGHNAIVKRGYAIAKEAVLGGKPPPLVPRTPARRNRRNQCSEGFTDANEYVFE